MALYVLFFIHVVFVQSMSNCADASDNKEQPMDSNN